MHTISHHAHASRHHVTIRPKTCNFFCKSSVDTPPTGVDPMLQTQGQMMKKWSSSVNTESSSVDTMLQTQGKMMKKWSSGVDTESSSGVDTGSSSVDIGSSSVDTGSSSVDTRDPSQKYFVPVWDSVSTHPMGRSTHSGNFSTISHIWTRGTLGIL
ncbi:hypothetical protein Taro_054484 [Colocasia esculenta]|uniref:Uncharacterized protein n=1 Tax=Colocasia esculenta TaxID=4460 RepID=A0A843XRA1_COLES|nr:hypothetical protein [Colocasia esculenta]